MELTYFRLELMFESGAVIAFGDAQGWRTDRVVSEHEQTQIQEAIDRLTGVIAPLRNNAVAINSNAVQART